MTKPRLWMDWNPPQELIDRVSPLAEIVTDRDESKLPGSRVVSVTRTRADGAFMDRVGPSLVAIARPGIGVDNIDVDAATERGILVSNTPDAPTESTAEHAVALLLAVAKRVMVGDMFLRGDTSIQRTDMHGTEVRDRVLGVVGYGRIGRRVAEICALGLKMRVRVHDPYLAEPPTPPEGIEFVEDLDAIFAESDFVTLHVPLMPTTRHLANERRLRLMKPGSYLINASRGPVVDEAALIRVLEEGHLAGAGLDVFDPEPPEPDNPLLRMKNVVVTPHIASATDRGLTAMREGTIENLVNILSGRRPRWMVNPQAWPGRMGEQAAS